MRSKAISLLWLFSILLMFGWLIFRISSGPWIDTNIMTLLPKLSAERVLSNTVGKVQKRLSRQLVWLVGAPDAVSAKAAAADVLAALDQSGEFLILKGQQDKSLINSSAEFYLPMRFSLLCEDTRQLLQAGETRPFKQSILERYFSPQSTLSSGLIQHDPLLLLPNFFENCVAQLSEKSKFEDGYLIIQADSGVYVILRGVLKGSPYSLKLQNRLMPLMEKLKGEIAARYRGSEILTTGVLLHAAAGVERGLTEISTVGFGSMLGVVLLIFVVFRSFRPLALSLCSIFVGIGGGLAVCLLAFGKVHMLTLIFGSSLIGISVDYSFHFFCDRFRYGDTWNPRDSIRYIFPGIALGLLTSIIGFAGLFFAPFHGMQEMAVFSCVGLSFAFCCVILWYPLFVKNLVRPKYHVLLQWAQRYQNIWLKRWNWRVHVVGAVLAIVLGYGCFQLNPQDDVRLMQTLDPEVLSEELLVRRLVGRNLSSQFFLIEGNDSEDFLIREERVTRQLKKLRDNKQIAGYLAISDFIPSSARQLENRRLLKSAISGKDGVLAEVASTIGLAENIQSDYVDTYLRAIKKPPVQLEQWLAHPVSEPYRHLWLGQTESKYVGVIGLKGVFDMDALRVLADQDDGVHFLDPAGEISNLFRNYRQQTTILTVFSYIVVGIVLAFRYGLQGSAAILAGPIVAAFASFGILGLVGEPISLFNVMALLLVLGIGVDYALFFRETGYKHPSTLVAIGLSSVTTLLGFGLLALSSTTAVHAFGVTILIGILVAFLLSPFAGSVFAKKALP